MPHYPSEIEYSERYDDGDYEYRHVVLTKEVFKKLPRNRLLSEAVTPTPRRNGADSEFSNRAAGCTTKFTAPNLTSSSSAGPRAPILRRDCRPLASCLPLIPTLAEPASQLGV
jgi:cyclin-dependent kinase regulatory subunit CKS1